MAAKDNFHHFKEEFLLRSDYYLDSSEPHLVIAGSRLGGVYGGKGWFPQIRAEASDGGETTIASYDNPYGGGYEHKAEATQIGREMLKFVKAERAAKAPGLKGLREEVYPLFQREMNARDNMIETIMERGELNARDAELVFDFYRSRATRAIRLDRNSGRYLVTHGGFMDKEVIQRALTAAKDEE